MIKTIMKSKLFLFIKICIICLITSFSSFSEESEVQKKMVAIGPNEAEVKIKVFSSLTCPHCANFHKNVVSKLKKIYMNSGKVQIIFIDFPLDQAAFNASKLLHCTDKNKQIDFLDIIYETQDKWTVGSNINDINKNLKEVVEKLGITPEKFDKCLVDVAISDKILNKRIEANKKYSIESTPTVIINDKKLKGSISFENIKKTIEKII
tara:strand:- start:3091 stop:3714 length:624 start_codon:yes stop_codon:yes gene_type:complete